MDTGCLEDTVRPGKDTRQLLSKCDGVGRYGSGSGKSNTGRYSISGW